MTQTERVFPFNKSIMLNVIYDTLDRLGAAVESCNSERGALDFCLGGQALRLTAETLYPEENTWVRLSAAEAGEEAPAAVLDEITATIRQTQSARINEKKEVEA